MRQDAYILGVEFRGKADFSRLGVGGNLKFSETGGLIPTRFEECVIFVGATLEGTVTFSGVSFIGEADFQGARFGGHADFTNAVFRRNALFSLAHFTGHAFFAHAHFSCLASFGSVTADRDLHFEGACFEDELSFVEARLRRLCWGRLSANGSWLDVAQFTRMIDLRGCTYDRTTGPWRLVLAHLVQYDNQVYDQLEAALHRAGEDHSADEVYIAARDRERERYRAEDLIRFCFYTIYRWLVGYGVRTRWLFWWALCALIIGCILFHEPGAVVPITPAHNVQSVPAVGSQMPVRLSWTGAFWVSLDQFLPFGIPAGSQWHPGDSFVSAAVGTVLRILGWVFVPLGTAGLTGLLRRLRH